MENNQTESRPPTNGTGRFFLKIYHFLESVSFPVWSVPLAIVILGVVTYGLYLPRLGLYWDDWAKLLAGRLWGMDSYWAYYAEDRPFSAWTHIVLTPWLGYNPLPWQIFTFVMRLLSVGGIWWTIKNLWPEKPRLAIYASLLLLVYPVFDQQAIAVTFHQQWMQFALLAFSFGLTVKAMRQKKRYWLFTVFSLLLSAVQLLITEYFVGLELVRLPILWLLVCREESSFFKRLGKAIYQWLPYVILLSVYVIWRTFFIKLSGPDPYKATVFFQLFNQPLSTLVELVKMAAVDSFYILVSSWAQALDIGLALSIPKSLVIIWGIGLLAAVLSGLYLWRVRDDDTDGKPVMKTWLLQVLFIGLAALLCGCLQAWLTGRRVIEDAHADRYAMPAMLGASLIIAALIEWGGRRRLQKALTLSVLIGLSVIFQVRALEQFAKIWQDQQNFFWQMAWRAPAIEPVTAILNEEEFFPNQGMFSSSAALNLAYPQSNPYPGLLDYWAYAMNPLFNRIGAVNHPTDVNLSTQFRTLVFKGHTPDSIVIYYDSQRTDCLWILRPDNADNPFLPELTRKMLPASNLTRIKATAAADGYPPQTMFGNEPEHGFCYLFQKAELARQDEDTSRWLKLSEEAVENYGDDLERYKTPHEWLTFIEGFARAGRWQDAKDLTLQARVIRDGEFSSYFCSTWMRLNKETPDGTDKDEAVSAVSNELGCQKN